jgi:hypothetical protein
MRAGAPPAMKGVLRVRKFPAMIPGTMSLIPIGRPSPAERNLSLSASANHDVHKSPIAIIT